MRGLDQESLEVCKMLKLLKAKYDYSIGLIMNIPKNYKSKLIEAHEECLNILKSPSTKWKFDYAPEALEIALLVEEHRWFWKPETVKFIFVGESHVYTDENEIRVKIDPTRLPKNTPKSIPLNFVRLVYCLGNGSPSILTAPEKIKNNPRRSPYTNLFAGFLGFGRKPKRMQLLDWKIKVLKAVRENGIWLLDASVHACYLGNGKRLPQRLVERIIPVSWKKYVKPIIDDLSIDESHIRIIGKTLHSILARASWGIDWIYQPNARFRSSEQYREKSNREKKTAEVIQHRICK